MSRSAVVQIIFRGREMKAREPKPDIATALTVDAFCEMFCVTPELYAALKQTGRGPREVRVGRCPLWLCPRKAHKARRQTV
jgi:hypothetical protein